MNEFDQRQKILIVDDEPTNIEILNEILQGDYRILFSTNGEDAIKIAHAKQPDLILLDVMMPGMDGNEVCTKLKASQDTTHIPIIFVTAMTEAKYEAMGLQLGAVDYISKPINPAIVQLRVRNHLELKQHRDRLDELVRQRTEELNKAKLEAESGNRAKSEFMMIVSHELRTPLNSILGFSDLLKGQVEGSESLEVVELIEQSGQKLLRLINKILEIVNIESEREGQLVRHPFRISKLVDQAVDSFSHVLDEKGVSFHYKPSIDMVDDVLGDKRRLGIILTSLIDNAVKYTDHGRITLSVEQKRINEKKLYHFALEDTGIGISKEKHEEIFQYFTQAWDSASVAVMCL